MAKSPPSFPTAGAGIPSRECYIYQSSHVVTHKHLCGFELLFCRVYSYIEPPRPEGRRFRGNHCGCVDGLGNPRSVPPDLPRLIPRRGLPRVVPPATWAGFSRNYALTFPGGKRDGDMCYFYTSGSHATFLSGQKGSHILTSYHDDAIHFTSPTNCERQPHERIQLYKSEHAHFSKGFA